MMQLCPFREVKQPAIGPGGYCQNSVSKCVDNMSIRKSKVFVGVPNFYRSYERFRSHLKQ